MDVLSTTLGIVSFNLIALSVVLSLLSIRRFVGGALRNYYLITNLGLIFVIVSYFIWATSDFLCPTCDPQGISIAMSVIMMVSSGIFIKSSFDLNKLSKLYGFKRNK